MSQIFLPADFPYNVTSATYTSTFTVDATSLRDLTSVGSFLVSTTANGLLYGELSPCAQVTTTSFSPDTTSAKRLSLRKVAAEATSTK